MERKAPLTVCDASRARVRTASVVAALIGHDDHFGVVFNHRVREDLG